MLASIGGTIAVAVVGYFAYRRMRRYAALYRLYLGIADGMSIARVGAVPVLKLTASGRGGRFEYRHAHTRATDMPSAMPR